MSDSFPEESAIIAEAVIDNYAWLNWLAGAALLFGGVATFSKLTGNQSFSVWDIEFKAQHTVLIYFVFTAIHSFLLKLIMDSAYEANQLLTDLQRLSLFRRVVHTGGFLTRGSQDYVGFLKARGIYLHFKNDLRSTSSWLQSAILLFAFTSMVPFEWSGYLPIYFFVAWTIAYMNWNIAANWLIALADMGREGGSSQFYAVGSGPRGISTASGFFIGPNIDVNSYVRGTLLGGLMGVTLVSLLYLAGRALFMLVSKFV